MMAAPAPATTATQQPMAMLLEEGPVPDGRTQGIAQTAAPAPAPPPMMTPEAPPPATAAPPVATPAPAPAAPAAPTYQYQDSNKAGKFGPPQGFFDDPAYSSWLSDEGLIQWLPNVNDLPAFFADAGLTDNPDMRDHFFALANAVEDLRKIQAEGPDAPDYQKRLNTALDKIQGKTSRLSELGWNFDVNALFEGGVAPAGTPPAQPPSGSPGTVDPPAGDGGTPGDVDLGEINPDVPIPDWLKNTTDPEIVKAWLDWLGYEQARDDRQVAVDYYGAYGDYLENDPTRASMEAWIGGGPRYTLTPEIIDAIKANSRSMAGSQAASAEQILRERAAGLGQPTGTSSGDLLRARADIYGNLSQQLSQVDIDAARQKTEDEKNYWNTLLGGVQTLGAPMGGYYGGMAGLIAGAPNLAGTGNPYAGMADFLLANEQANAGPGAMHGRDWVGVGAGAAGSALGAWLGS